MRPIAAFIVHRSKLVLALTGLVTLVAVALLFRLDFNADVASFILEGTPTGTEFLELQEKYDTSDPINAMASLPEGETFADKDNLVLLFRLEDSIRSVEGVGAAVSVIPASNPSTGAPITEQDIASIPEALVSGLVSSNPLSSLLLSEDGRHALVFVSPDSADVTSVAREVIEVEVEGLDVVYSGNPVIFASVIDLLSLFLLLIPPVVIILLIATFYANIGDRRLSVLAIIPAAIGSVWTFGLIFGLGLKADIVTVIVPIFVIVMGSADGLHFVTHFQEEADNPDPVDRVASALSHVGIPMILTTVSTAAGFLSLMATGVDPIEQLGLFAAIGIVFAGIISFFSLPAAISHMEVTASHENALIGPRVVRGLKALVRTRVPAIVITVVILGFAAISLPKLDVNPDQLFFFKADDPVRVAFERTSEVFGGATPMLGEFTFDPSGSPDQLGVIAGVSEEMEALAGVREVFSLADLAESIPEDQLQAVLSGAQELPLGKMVSEDGLRFTLLPEEFDSADLQGWVDYADSEPTVAVLTGMPLVWDEIARAVLNAQMISLGVAFVLVAIMLALAYRRARETFASLVPIALTIAAVLGFIAVTGIQLNLLTAVISSIVLGVGIDYAIHFVAAIDIARADGPGYVYRALDRAGRPIVANAMGVAIALTALWLSPLLIHSQVSSIMWVGMIASGLTALVVLPALLPRAGIEEPPTPS
ncbi:MAG: MMPL family transporter [Actinomycetota bacterium]|nr:MMPL family transporter [Actinomycetota bacterium]